MAATYIPCLYRDCMLCNGLGILRGSTWSVVFNINYLMEDGITKVPLDLTGYTGKCTIKSAAGSTTIIAEPSVNILNPEKGVVQLHLTDEQTSAIPTTGDKWYKITTLQYDVLLENGDGEVFRVLCGLVEVSPRVTTDIDTEVEQ